MHFMAASTLSNVVDSVERDGEAVYLEAQWDNLGPWGQFMKASTPIHQMIHTNKALPLQYKTLPLIYPSLYQISMALIGELLMLNITFNLTE